MLTIRGTDVVDNSEVGRKLGGLVDVRLTKLENSFLMTYADSPPSRHAVLYGEDRPEDWQDSPNCCLLMFGQRMRYSEELDTILVDEPKLLCSNLTSQYEKNWSPWLHQDKVNISYHLTPRHIAFQPIGASDQCTFQESSQPSIFEQIADHFSNRAYISLSTPSIQLNEIEYIAAGHIKIFPEELPTWIKSMPHHANGLVYLMFLYTFDPVTLNIIRTTDAFLPPTTQVAVVYPVGLTMNRDNVIVSYGEADREMKLLFINKSRLDDMLIKDQTLDTFGFAKYSE